MSGAYKCEKGKTHTAESLGLDDTSAAIALTESDETIVAAVNTYCNTVHEIDALETNSENIDKYAETVGKHISALNAQVPKAIEMFDSFIKLNNSNFGTFAKQTTINEYAPINSVSYKNNLFQAIDMIQKFGEKKTYGNFFKDYDLNDPNETFSNKNQINISLMHLWGFISHLANEDTSLRFREEGLGIDHDVRALASGASVDTIHTIAIKAYEIYSFYSIGTSVDPDAYAQNLNMVVYKSSDDVKPVSSFTKASIAKAYDNDAHNVALNYRVSFDDIKGDSGKDARATYFNSYNLFQGINQRISLARETIGAGGVTVLIWSDNTPSYSNYEWLSGVQSRDIIRAGLDDRGASSGPLSQFVDSQNEFYTSSSPGKNFFHTATEAAKRLVVYYTKEGETQKATYAQNIFEFIKGMQSHLKSNIEPHIVGIIEAAREYAETIDDAQEELTDAIKDLKKAFNPGMGFGRGWTEGQNLAGHATIYNSLIGNALNPARKISSVKGQTDAYYRKNPEKLFYKEQCYLLSYISGLSSYKKNSVDDVRTRAKFTYDPAGGPDKVIQKLGGGKRVPFTNKLLGPKEFQWSGNSSLLLDGDPYAFINKLAISKNLGPLINIEPHVLSNLQPFVRLYKVIYDKNGQEREVEIKFESSRNQFESDLFANRRVRNTGVGLKDFTFTYDGANPFGAKKSIKASLNIFSNSFDELMICRGAGKCDDINHSGFNSSYRYVDLALKTFNNKNKNKTYGSIYRENDELAKLNFRLKAQVGYSMPGTFTHMTNTNRKELQRALRDSIVTLNLIPTVHDFNFDDMGRVNFTINYLAFIEDLFSQAKFNVFSEPLFAKNRILRQSKMKYYNKTCNADAVRQIKEGYAQTSKEEIADSISHLISLMMDRDKIRYLEVSMDQIKDFVSYGPFSELNNKRAFNPGKSNDYFRRMQKNIDESLELFKERGAKVSVFGDEEEKITASLATIDSSVEVLAFFYVSDLIDIILENIENELLEMPNLLRKEVKDNPAPVMVDNEEIENKIDEYQKFYRAFAKTRYLFGPVEFVDPKNNNSFFVNLGDVPVSLKYFFEWLTSTMLDRDDSFYSLSRFLNEFFNDFLKKFLNNDRCFDYSIKQRTKFNQATLLGTRVGPHDKITNLILEEKNARLNIDSGAVKKHLPLIHSYGLASNSANNYISPNSEINYMVYFIGRTLPTEKMNGIRVNDEKMGVFHYQIGRDKGLVKNIQLTKTQTPGLQEVRFEQQGYDGLEQLRVVYDAKIQSYSNVNTFPGSYIYIDPAGYAPRSHPTKLDLTKYGVGGYYMIVKSTHSFGPGMADSEIEAKWVNQLYDPDSTQPQYARETTSTEDSKNLKCTTHIERETKAKE